MWADWRAKVDDLSSDDVLILGSSRGHFDLNIHLWDSITGNRPVNACLSWQFTTSYNRRCN